MNTIVKCPTRIARGVVRCVALKQIGMTTTTNGSCTMGEIGGYELHLYCDSVECVEEFTEYGRVFRDAAVFTGRNVTEARREARKCGWRMTRSEGHLYEGTEPRWHCPGCVNLRPGRFDEPLTDQDIREVYVIRAVMGFKRQQTVYTSSLNQVRVKGPLGGWSGWDILRYSDEHRGTDLLDGGLSIVDDSCN